MTTDAQPTGAPEAGSDSPKGIDGPEVTAWFRTNVPSATPPLAFALIAGGHSNLTFQVTDATGARWVLRRPPLGQVLASAHDMGREHRIISALAPTPVPVAPAVGFCDDESVNGAPFYVMDFVDGVVARDATIATQALDEEQRRTATRSLAETLAQIHAVDIDAVGLGDLGRREGYIERQLKRWQGQYEKSKTRELAAMDQAVSTLAKAVPEQGPATIVHGDYRLDNCMLGSDGQVIAVLDWEICTLGDPMADLGLLMVYWTEPGDPASALPNAPTTVEGFGSRADVLEYYAQASGRDLGDIGYYQAFGYWKLACIIEGVYARYAGGAMGTPPEGYESFGESVKLLADLANQMLAGS